MGCAPSFLSDQKDGNILFCINFRRTRRRCSLHNGNDVITTDDLNNSNLCNQSLLNPMQIKNESDYDKMSSGKKDSIVTVAALGNLAGFNTIHTVVRRTTGSTGTSSSSGRLGHRKSSLALTPEDESMDTNNQKTSVAEHLSILGLTMRDCFLKVTSIFRSRSNQPLESNNIETQSYGYNDETSPTAGEPPQQSTVENCQDKINLITKPNTQTKSFLFDKNPNKNCTSPVPNSGRCYRKNSIKSCKPSYQVINKCVTNNDKSIPPASCNYFEIGKTMNSAISSSDDDSCHSVQLRVKIPPFVGGFNKVGRSLTPEEIEYQKNVVDEGADIATPLPLPNAKQFTFTNARPEIAEVIRDLDPYALRINNLTAEDKTELIKRFTKAADLTTKSNQRTSNTGRNQLKSKNRSASVGTDSPKRRPTGLLERRQADRSKLQLQIKNVSRTTINRDKSREKSLMDLKYPTVLPPNPQLKALIVFHKTDNVCDVFTTACHRQQLEVTLVKSKELALETLQNNAATDNYHLIIIDARSSKYLDAEYITRSIRHTTGYHFTTIIAVVKKSFFDKDELPLIALLDAGVNRCIAETTSVPICCTEMKQILHSIVRPHNVMSTQQALYTALHRLKEVLIITDDVLRIQYANKSAERLLNMRLDEIISKPLADVFVSDVSSISAHGKNIKEFDGILTVKRKGHDGIPMHVRVVPVACIGRQPTHYVFNFDVPGGQTDFIASLPQPKEAPRGSLHSIRRGSFDVRSVASDGLRRTSLAKLTSLPLEAPITKIINLLSQVQENCSSDEAKLIDKVMEFLKREGLYSPQMKEIRTEDPIATDLIGALLTGPSLYSSRRSSNDSIIRTSNSRPSGILPAKMKATPLIMELLEESLSWEFDIFKLEEITEHRPLLYLGMEMFRRFDVFATFNVEENVFKTWLAVIEAHYHSQNTYHNSTHAADVMQATGAFMTQLASKEMVMDRMDEATALIASAAHDIDHPGRSSAFLCNSNSPLAIMYNDLTVLESHHAATTFKLTLGDDKINIFKNLDKDTYKSVRSVIIDMILATEMTRHFENLAKFVSVFGTDVEPKDIVQSEDDSQILIRRMLIKVADVSNPARPLHYCVEWARRIAEEYFTQTDEEKAKALPIVMPMFDRATCSIPKSQIGFIEFIIQDMIHAWDSFIDMPQLITHMQLNYSQWKKFEEQGVHTLADIKTKQLTMGSKAGVCK